jgi:hypothetical protein
LAAGHLADDIGALLRVAADLVDLHLGQLLPDGLLQRAELRLVFRGITRRKPARAVDSTGVPGPSPASSSRWASVNRSPPFQAKAANGASVSDGNSSPPDASRSAAAGSFLAAMTPLLR